MNISIQKATFPNGGFVLHHIPSRVASPRNARISAWYDVCGAITAAEFMPSGRSIKAGSPSWNHASAFGPRSINR